MREIKTNILENVNKFDLIVLPCSQFLKKDGTICIDKNNKKSIVAQLFDKIPTLNTEMGDVVETYGCCPYIFHTIKGTQKPCKLATFPITPSAQSIKAENREKYVLPHLLKGMRGTQTLVPGWMLYPRSDIVEFACRKLEEIIKWYKLSNVVLPWDSFNIPENSDHEGRIKNILNKYLPNEVFLVTSQVEQQGERVGMSVTSTVEYEEGE
jgi:hypothetical protein